MCLKDQKKNIADITHLRKPRVFGPLRSPKEPIKGFHSTPLPE